MTSRLLFATSNKGKENEIRRILSGLNGWEIFFLDSFGNKIEPPEETGKDFSANSMLKAVYYKKYFEKYFVAAEDSGLSVPALGGAPGVYSARYEGLADDVNKADALLEAMKSLISNERKAYFEAVITLLAPDGGTYLFSGRVDGTISYEQEGSNGFGYDPVFIPDGKIRTFAEMPPEEKDGLSHRKKALMELKEFLVGTAG
jgi:XTP/dITP diphosphohydrolase